MDKGFRLFPEKKGRFYMDAGHKASLLRLCGAVLVEIDEKWLAKTGPYVNLIEQVDGGAL